MNHSKYDNNLINNSNSSGYCTSDLDCVPASCCHSNSCSLKSGTPKCDAILCSQECRPGTLDCGQGSCSCVDNKCKAVIN